MTLFTFVSLFRTMLRYSSKWLGFNYLIGRKLSRISDTMEKPNFKNQLIDVFLQSVAAINPSKLVAENLNLQGNNLQVCDKVYEIGNGQIYLIGFGKAVFGMAFAAENILGERLARGAICVPENIQETYRSRFGMALKRNTVIKVYEGAKNNLPDKNAENGADAIIDLIKCIDSELDLLLVLISGGGSALFPKPKPGITLDEKLETVKMLASAGADITELNKIRKQLSSVKGGGLACLSYPNRTVSLIISDVVNDPLDIIASGPTVPNSDDDDEALAIVNKYNLLQKIPEKTLKIIGKTDDSFVLPLLTNKFLHVDNFVIGNNTKALLAAKQHAENCGFKVFILSSKVQGSINNVADFYKTLIEGIVGCLNSECSDFSQFQNAITNCHFEYEENFLNDAKTFLIEHSNIKNMCIIAGGETIVKLTGNGKGGHNQQLSLEFLIRLDELRQKNTKFFDQYNVTFLCAGTDGIDGPTDAAGAVIDCFDLMQIRKDNLNIEKYLSENDSFNFYSTFQNGANLIRTGHTGTNVADIHLLAIFKKHI